VRRYLVGRISRIGLSDDDEPALFRETDSSRLPS